MQKIILSLSAIICFTLSINSQSLISVLNNSVLDRDVNRVELDIKNSIVKWEGSNLFKINKHNGTVKFKNGHVLKKNGNILGGEFIIEMESIVNTDGKPNDRLVNHLKNEDFFDVKKYPNAKLQINNVIYESNDSVSIIANLTIKGITKEIQFNPKFNVIDKKEVMTSKFTIDRTLWGINYESKGTLGAVKDDIISDTIELEVIVQWPFIDQC
ncbi:YceI family protein [uncultured Algibacter sp.]|uniref:YceI family protein n=1 Tax=uncultured Algibacter sp. TaxID=298659 RepID=UPI002611E633|nr:YceI family protein [uncultured Algibacter sp.]